MSSQLLIGKCGCVAIGYSQWGGCLRIGDCLGSAVQRRLCGGDGWKL